MYTYMYYINIKIYVIIYYIYIIIYVLYVCVFLYCIYTSFETFDQNNAITKRSNLSKEIGFF